MTPAPLLLKRANGRLLLMGPAYLQRPSGSSMHGSESGVRGWKGSLPDSSNTPE